MTTPSDRTRPAKLSESPYRDPPEGDPATSDLAGPVRAAMLTSILFGALMLPVGLWVTWRGAASLFADLNRGVAAGLAVAVFAPCAGVVIASIAITRLSAGLSLLQLDTEAAGRAHAAASISFWGEAAILLGLLLTSGGYGIALVVLVIPYGIPSILQSIALENAASRLDATRMMPRGRSSRA